MELNGIISNNGTTAVRVTELEDLSAWNGYLHNCKAEVLYHRVEWDQVFRVYGLPVIRLMAWRNEQVAGVLPLVWQRSWIFGSRLISLPWFDAAGVLADDEHVSESLVSAALQLSVQYRTSGLLLRQRKKVDSWQHDRSDKVLMRLPLVRDPQELWKGFSSKVRNQVRKAEKSGLTAVTCGSESLVPFFSVYSENMRDLGSPSHSRGFFETVLQAFPSDAKLHLVRLDDRVIGAGLTLANGKCLEIPWASSLREFNSMCVNHLMYWHILQYACSGGYNWFHFGRSTLDSGTYQFKKQWGAEAEPLHWYQFDATDRAGKSTQALQEQYQWATKAWQKLPLWFTRVIGPRVVSNLP